MNIIFNFKNNNFNLLIIETIYFNIKYHIE